MNLRKNENLCKKKKKKDQEIKFMCLVREIEIRKIHLDRQRNFFIMWEQYQIGRKTGRDLLASLALSAWPVIHEDDHKLSSAEEARGLPRLVPACGKKCLLWTATRTPGYWKAAKWQQTPCSTPGGWLGELEVLSCFEQFILEEANVSRILKIRYW